MRDIGDSDSPDLGRILRFVSAKTGVSTPDVARAYADWRRFTKQKNSLKKPGISAIQASSNPVQGKNATDIRMAVEIVDLMHKNPGLKTFVLVTGDSDFNPLVELLRENGKTVIGIGVPGAVSRLFSDSCNEFFNFTDLPEISGRKPEIRRESQPKRNVERDEKPKSAPIPENSSALEVLGLQSDHTIKASTLRRILPLAQEAWDTVRPNHPAEFRKAIISRHQGIVTSQQAAILAHLLRSVGAYGQAEKVGWFALATFDGDEGFDMLLASAQDSLQAAKLEEARDPVLFTKLITGETIDERELRMRLKRGHRALEEAVNDR